MTRVYSLNLRSVGAGVALVLAIVLVSGLATVAYAATSSDDTDLSQVINAGTFTVEFRDASRVQVASPVVNFGAETFSFDCLTGGTAAEGTLGTGTERLYIDNPDAADAGFDLDIAATDPTDVWVSAGAAPDYDFNDIDASAEGCLDDATTGDTDSLAGLLNVDASVATINADCASGCGSTGWTLGSATDFQEGTTNSINLVSGAAGQDDVGRWYLTGIALDQDIPAEQPADTYTITMTVTGTTL